MIWRRTHSTITMGDGSSVTKDGLPELQRPTTVFWALAQDFSISTMMEIWTFSLSTDTYSTMWNSSEKGFLMHIRTSCWKTVAERFLRTWNFCVTRHCRPRLGAERPLETLTTMETLMC